MPLIRRRCRRHDYFAATMPMTRAEFTDRHADAAIY